MKATHIENINIASYRGIRDLNLDNLGAVNIFVGDNNTGKTSVLEAIQFFCAPNKNNLVKIARQRERLQIRMGVGFIDSIKYLFDVNSNDKEHYEFIINGTANGNENTIRVTGSLDTQLIDLQELASQQHIPQRVVDEGLSEVETFYGKIERKGAVEDFEINKYSKISINSSKDNRVLNNQVIQTADHIMVNAFNRLIKNSIVKDKAVKLLRNEFDEDITDLRIIPDSQGIRFIPMIEKENGEYMPLSVFGDGMKKTLTMLNAIVSTENGVVLIDEFETALHTSAMKQVFSFAIQSARESNVQLFLTTHSLEAVDKIIESAGVYSKDLRVIRLKKKNGKTFSNILNGEEALAGRKKYNWELRV